MRRNSDNEFSFGLHGSYANFLNVKKIKESSHSISLGILLFVTLKVIWTENVGILEYFW